MVHRINFPFIDPELSRQPEPGGDLGSHHPFCEWGLGLSDQIIYGNWRARASVDDVNTGVQISDLLGGGFISASGRLFVSAR